MISGFHIKCVQVTGPGKNSASIEFQKGLNVISGPSDTGKSYLMQCLNYMMGGDTPPKDIEEAEGYDCIWMEISTGSGDTFTLKRKMGDSELLLIKDKLPEAKTSTVFKILHSRHNNKKEDNISIFLLKLLDLVGKQLKQSKSEKRPIRFTDVKTIFLKDENEIITEGSPISTGQYTSATIENSLFNLLLSGEDDEDLATIEDPKVYKKILNAKIEITQTLLQEEKEKIRILQSNISKEKQQEIIDKIDEISRSIKESNALIKEQETDRNHLLKRLNNLNQHIIHLKELLENFSLLDEHYSSDLQRLEFMLEGEHLLSQLPTRPCPTCGSEVESDKLKDFLEENNRKAVDSINREMEKILVKREELDKTTKDIQKELSEYIHVKDKLQNELDIASGLLEKKLRPTQQILNNDLEEYISLKQNIARLEDAEINVEQYTHKIETYQQKIKEKPKKDIRRVLPEEHYQKLCDVMAEQLTSWGMVVKQLQFNKAKMDFIINGKARHNYGKGSRAILCSAFLISFMKYCWEQETHHPTTVILDSPLTTYREGDKPQENEEIGVTVQNEFFSDLANISPNFQIIIFDNKDPSVKIRDKINYYHFTRNRNIGRFGFFPMGSDSQV